MVKKQIFGRILLGVMGIVAAFGISIAADSVLGWYLGTIHYFKAMPPNFTKVYDTSEFTVEARISSQGLRNEEVAVPKPDSTFRILAVGDSFTYGWGVDVALSWPKLLEKSLNVPGKKVEVINAGLPGAGPTDERRVCRAYKDWFEADAIILGIYRDDFYQAAARQERLPAWVAWMENTWPTVFQVAMPIIGISKAWEQANFGQQGVIRSSEVWRDEVAYGLKQNPTILLKIDPKLRQDFLHGKINPALVGRSAGDPNFLTYILDDDLANIAFSAMDQRLERFAKRCGGEVPVAVVFFPGPTLVSEYYLDFKKELGYVVDERLTKFDIETPLKGMVEKYNFTYFSILPDFRQDECLDCFYPYDGHMTVQGNQRTLTSLLPAFQKWLDGVYK